MKRIADKRKRSQLLTWAQPFGFVYCIDLHAHKKNNLKRADRSVHCLHLVSPHNLLKWKVFFSNAVHNPYDIRTRIHVNISLINGCDYQCGYQRDITAAIVSHIYKPTFIVMLSYLLGLWKEYRSMTDSIIELNDNVTFIQLGHTFSLQCPFV